MFVAVDDIKLILNPPFITGGHLMYERHDIPITSPSQEPSRGLGDEDTSHHSVDGGDDAQDEAHGPPRPAEEGHGRQHYKSYTLRS